MDSSRGPSHSEIFGNLDKKLTNEFSQKDSVDAKIFELLRANYDIVSVITEIDRTDSMTLTNTPPLTPNMTPNLDAFIKTDATVASVDSSNRSTPLFPHKSGDKIDFLNPNLQFTSTIQHLELPHSTNSVCFTENDPLEQNFSPKKKAFNLWSFRKSTQRRASIATPQQATPLLMGDIVLGNKQLVRPQKSKTFDGTSSSAGEDRDDLSERSQSHIGAVFTDSTYSNASSSSPTRPKTPTVKNSTITQWQRFNNKFKEFGSNVLEAVTSDSTNMDSSPSSTNLFTANKIATTEMEAGNENQKKNSKCNANEDTSASIKLSPSTLKRDIRRCANEVHIYAEIGSALHDIIIWKNPFTTLLLFVIYMYSVLRGWLVPLIFSLVLTQLGLNWLEVQKKISFGLFLFPRQTISTTGRKTEHSGAQLVFDVARRTQQLLTVAGGVLEKLRYLFEWRQPEVTIKFLYILLTFFSLSLVLSTSWWFVIIGFLVGGKIFIMTYLYHRFPRLRPLLDIAYYFYTHLPTSLQVSNSSQLQMRRPTSSKSSENSFRKRNASFRSYLNTRRASSVDIAVAVATSGIALNSNISTHRYPRPKSSVSQVMAGAMLSPMFASRAVNARRKFAESPKQPSIIRTNQSQRLGFSSTANEKLIVNKNLANVSNNQRRSSMNTLLPKNTSTSSLPQRRRFSRPLTPNLTFIRPTNKLINKAKMEEPNFSPISKSGSIEGNNKKSSVASINVNEIILDETEYSIDSSTTLATERCITNLNSEESFSDTNLLKTDSLNGLRYEHNSHDECISSRGDESEDNEEDDVTSDSNSHRNVMENNVINISQF